MPRLALVVVALTAVTGCYQDNPESCQNAMPSHPELCMSTGGPCKNSSECLRMNSMLPVCDTAFGGGTCVQCLPSERGQCTGMTPRCDVHTCVACVDNGDCGTNGLCLPRGDCVAAERIIHATATGSMMNDCGAVGNECTLSKALTRVSMSKDVIKLDGSGPFLGDVNNFVVDIDVTIDARGALLQPRKGDSPVVTINGGRTATIFGGRIEGASGNAGDAILCNGGATLVIDGTTIDGNEKSAINAMGGSRLTVKKAVIRNSSTRTNTSVAAILANGDSITLSQSSLSSNRGSGLEINSGTFVIVGNAFFDNGSLINPKAAVVISTGMNAVNRFDFNTIAHNSAQPDLNAGLDCRATSNLIASNNIIWHNFSGTAPQVTGNCKYAYSNIGQGSLPAGNDAGNNMFNTDPRLMTDPLLATDPSDPHLLMISPARGAADPDAILTDLAAKDIDGDARVKRADIGADQFHMP